MLSETTVTNFWNNREYLFWQILISNFLLFVKRYVIGAKPHLGLKIFYDSSLGSPIETSLCLWRDEVCIQKFGKKIDSDVSENIQVVNGNTTYPYIHGLHTQMWYIKIEFWLLLLQLNSQEKWHFDEIYRNSFKRSHKSCKEHKYIKSAKRIYI